MIRRLAILTVCLMVSLGMVYQSWKIEPCSEYNDMIEASEHMKTAMDTLQRDYFFEQELTEKLRPLEHVLIGEDFNDITTTLGSLDSKLTSINPNFAAYVYKVLSEQGVGRGDAVALNFSSSFPALNIAVLSACEVMGAEVIQMTSLGSSTHGGNRPEYSYIDMQHRLLSHGILSAQNVLVSYGGENDLATGINKKLLDEMIKRNHLEDVFYSELDFYHNIEHRLSLYDTKPVKLFINVGGNIVSSGITHEVKEHSSGLILPINSPLNYEDGLIDVYLSRGIPVLNLLDIKTIAINEGLLVAPDYIQAVGQADLYYERGYNKGWIIASGLLIIGWLWTYGETYRKNRKAASRYKTECI